MEFRVGLFQIRDGETQVALRGGQGAVPQEILDVPQVGVVLDEMGGTALGLMASNSSLSLPPSTRSAGGLLTIETKVTPPELAAGFLGAHSVS